MKNRIASVIALAATAVSLVAVPASAMEGAPKDPNYDVHILSSIPPMEFNVTGVMESTTSSR